MRPLAELLPDWRIRTLGRLRGPPPYGVSEITIVVKRPPDPSSASDHDDPSTTFHLPGEVQAVLEAPRPAAACSAELAPRHTTVSYAGYKPGPGQVAAAKPRT